MVNSRVRRGPKMGDDERRAKVSALKGRLAEWEEEADESVIAAIIASFDGYSPRNAKLIAMQCPQATHVEGFKRWLDLGRCVRKGESGIAILAPAGKGRRDEITTESGKPETVAEWTAPGADPNAPGIEGSSPRERMFFRITYVFDISQTDALPARVDA